MRVARTCDEMGITPVFAVSQADAQAGYVNDRETVVIGPARSTQSYLNAPALVQAAKQTQCAAIHPGWGFLSENPGFVTLCTQNGITFIGPTASAMRLMGSKSPAKKVMAEAGLRVIPGSDGVVANAGEIRAVADAIGFPLLIKAESGGGGRGMRVVRNADEIQRAFDDASAEALAAFHDERVYVEKLIEGGRHVEIQILADKYGNVVHLGERDCTVQRNHQKLIEESPAPTLPDDERERTLRVVTEAVSRIGYVGAGTIEFLLDDGKLWFMEMNTRLQVEHTVSEMRSGIDLVQWQLRVAAGHVLNFQQKDIELKDHVIECRINAEDPNDGFRPQPGVISKWTWPTHEWLRVDTHVEAGYEVPPHYDSLLCKAIAKGGTREEASQRLASALGEFVCEGVPTTAGMHQVILRSDEFLKNDYVCGEQPGFKGGA